MFPLKITAMGIRPSSCQGREQLNSTSVDSSAGSSKPPTQTRAEPGVRWGLNQAFLPWPDCHQAACTLSVSPTLPLSLIFAPQTPSLPPARQKSTLSHPRSPGYSLSSVCGLSRPSHSQRWEGNIPLPLAGWLVGSTHMEGPSTWRAQDQSQTYSQGSPNKNCILENRVPFPHLALAHPGEEDGGGAWRVGVGGVHYSISGELPASPPPPGTCCVCAHSLGRV